MTAYVYRGNGDLGAGLGQRLAAARAEAARRCGLAAYPDELIAAFGAVDVDSLTWGRTPREEKTRRLARLAAARADLGLCPVEARRS